MNELDFASLDPNDPRDRRRALLAIPKDRTVVRKYHAELLDLFRNEMNFRRDDSLPDEDSWFENIYWCGLLLYLVGDPEDVPLMWEAKHINMDVGCGFDSQFLVGAGVTETIRYLTDKGHTKIAEYLDHIQASGELDDLPKWESYRISYFSQF